MTVIRQRTSHMELSFWKTAVKNPFQQSPKTWRHIHIHQSQALHRMDQDSMQTPEITHYTAAAKTVRKQPKQQGK